MTREQATQKEETSKRVLLRYENEKGQVGEREFTNEDAMIRWCEKQEAKGKTVHTLAISTDRV